MISSIGLMVPSAFDTCADRHDLRARRQQRRVLVEIEFAGVVDRHDAQRRAGLLAHQLPRDDVRVMLQPREDDLVARPQHVPAVTLRDEVDAVGRALGQDDRLRDPAR